MTLFIHQIVDVLARGWVTFETCKLGLLIVWLDSLTSQFAIFGMVTSRL